jgi:hypothetical protein
MLWYLRMSTLEYSCFLEWSPVAHAVPHGLYYTKFDKLQVLWKPRSCNISHMRACNKNIKLSFSHNLHTQNFLNIEKRGERIA